MMVTATLLSRLSTVFLLICMILISAYTVIAKEATTSTTARDKIQQRIDANKEKIEAKKETAAQRITTIKEKMATREAALKAKLDKFRDQKKAETADKVNANLNQINQKQTEQMLKHLDKMSALLTKLETQKGSSVESSTANVSIASASAVVKAQAAKDYTLTVTSESTVRKDAQKIRDMLHADLRNVRKLVIDAKQAVANAIRTARLEKGNNGKQ